MKAFGALSKQGTYFNYKNKKLSIRGWFIADIGYDQVMIDGKNATIGLQRPDVYNNFKEYGQRNSGFALEYFTDYGDVENVLSMELEVLNKGHSIYRSTYEVPVIYKEKSLLEHCKNKDVYICGLDSWIEKVIYFNNNILERIKGFYDEKQVKFYNVPPCEPDVMLNLGGVIFFSESIYQK